MTYCIAYSNLKLYCCESWTTHNTQLPKKPTQSPCHLVSALRQISNGGMKTNATIPVASATLLKVCISTWTRHGTVQSLLLFKPWNTHQRNHSAVVIGFWQISAIYNRMESPLVKDGTRPFGTHITNIEYQRRDATIGRS